MPPKPLASIKDAPFELDLPETATGGCSILMIGSTRSGKSTALKHIMDNYFKKSVGVLFSQSIKANAYKDMNYPLIAKSGAYVPELIHDFYRINMETKNHYPFLVIMDDMPLVKNDKELLKLMTIYRNSGLSSITCFQNVSLLNPTCRSNVNFVLLFRCNNTEQVEKVIKTFLRGYFPISYNFDQKIKLYNELTADYHFLFINNLTGELLRCKIAI